MLRAIPFKSDDKYHKKFHTMTKLALLFSFIVAITLHSYGQADSLAIVHFYSFEPAQGLKKTFEIFQDNESLTSQEEGGEVLIQMGPGSHSFRLQPGSGGLTLNIQSGMKYFVLCSSIGTLTLRTQSEAESDLKKVRGN